MSTATEARDEGMARTTEAADPRVILAIDAAIERANATGRRWSANDIRAQFPVSASSLAGSRVRAASQRRPREMVAIDREPSSLDSTHGHEIKVWIGAEHVEMAS